MGKNNKNKQKPIKNLEPSVENITTEETITFKGEATDPTSDTIITDEIKTNDEVKMILNDKFGFKETTTLVSGGLEIDVLTEDIIDEDASEDETQVLYNQIVTPDVITGETLTINTEGLLSDQRITATVDIGPNETMINRLIETSYEDNPMPAIPTIEEAPENVSDDETKDRLNKELSDIKDMFDTIEATEEIKSLAVVPSADLIDHKVNDVKFTFQPDDMLTPINHVHGPLSRFWHLFLTDKEREGIISDLKNYNLELLRSPWKVIEDEVDFHGNKFPPVVFKNVYQIKKITDNYAVLSTIIKGGKDIIVKYESIYPIITVELD